MAQKHYFIKLFHCNGIGDALKNLFRASKPKRFWGQGLALSAAGFRVPTVVAVGELRQFRVFRVGFVLTSRIHGQPLPVFLQNLEGAPQGRRDLRLKRDGLARLAELVRQFHRLGFVHGDLIANNLLVAVAEAEPQFYFMDNDRTSRFPRWWPAHGWKRNLVQLNRMPLAGVHCRIACGFSADTWVGGGSRNGIGDWCAGWNNRHASAATSATESAPEEISAGSCVFPKPLVGLILRLRY